jgi:hypothetical protein
MDALDGNAVAGALAEIFDGDMTTAEAVCRHCGARALVATCAVYVGGPGAVLRCRTCGGVVMVLVSVRGATRVDLGGIEALARARRP